MSCSLSPDLDKGVKETEVQEASLSGYNPTSLSFRKGLSFKTDGPIVMSRPAHSSIGDAARHVEARASSFAVVKKPSSSAPLKSTDAEIQQV